ncbi:MAG TPA: hypothetical protein IAB35_06120 [Candidatus Faecimonas gallistercoris]|nr:hypothetical protein [Candidatus Faecimonas gallistercoris]
MKNTIEKLLIIIGILNIIVISIFLTIPQTKANYEPQQCQWKTDISKNENFVFLGDSITDWYPIEELYEDMPIVNSGKAGYKTQDILEEMDELVYQYNPTKVVILIGTNDLNNDVPEDKMLENIEKIIKDIKKNRKKAKLYVQSIYPINNSDNDKINKDTVGVRTNETIQRVNKQIKKICKQQNVTYIDMYSELVDNEGNLILKYTKDGLHISELGYLKITRILLSYLEN